MNGTDLVGVALGDIERERNEARQREQAARQRNRRRYHEILLAAAEGRPVAAAELRKVMEALGLTPEQIVKDQSVIAAYRDRDRFEGEAAAATAAAEEAIRAVPAAYAERQRLWREINQKVADTLLAEAQAIRLRDEARECAVGNKRLLEENAELVALIAAHDARPS